MIEAGGYRTNVNRDVRSFWDSFTSTGGFLMSCLVFNSFVVDHAWDVKHLTWQQALPFDYSTKITFVYVSIF